MCDGSTTSHGQRVQPRALIWARRRLFRSACTKPKPTTPAEAGAIRIAHRRAHIQPYDFSSALRFDTGCFLAAEHRSKDIALPAEMRRVAFCHVARESY